MTRQIKQYLFSLWLRPVRGIIKHTTIIFFYLRLGIKKLIRPFGINVITVNYTISKIEGIESKLILAFEKINFPIIPLFKGRESTEHFDHVVYPIPRGKVFWSYTIATPSNEILRDVTWRHNVGIGTNLYAYKLFPWKTTQIPWTTAVLCWNDTDKNYHHRITTIVPKYYIFKKSGIKIDTYIADTNLWFHREWREALWIDISQIIPSDPHAYYQCDTLICTNTTTVFGIIQPRAKKFLCEIFLKDRAQVVANRKVYIKRITNRKIANETEFEKLMTDYGFQISVLDGMTIRQQAELFYEAKIVIWPHGAWLTNMIFSQPWTKVIELFHPQTIFGHYYAMAWSLWFDYTPLVWKMKLDTKKIEMDNDIIVDIEQVRKVLKTITY